MSFHSRIGQEDRTLPPPVFRFMPANEEDLRDLPPLPPDPNATLNVPGVPRLPPIPIVLPKIAHQEDDGERGASRRKRREKLSSPEPRFTILRATSSKKKTTIPKVVYPSRSYKVVKKQLSNSLFKSAKEPNVTNSQQCFNEQFAQYDHEDAEQRAQQIHEETAADMSSESTSIEYVHFGNTAEGQNVQFPADCEVFRMVHPGKDGVNREIVLPMPNGTNIIDALKALPNDFINYFENNSSSPPNGEGIAGAMLEEYEKQKKEREELEEIEHLRAIINRQYPQIIKKRVTRPRVNTDVVRASASQSNNKFTTSSRIPRENRPVGRKVVLAEPAMEQSMMMNQQDMYYRPPPPPNVRYVTLMPPDELRNYTPARKDPPKDAQNSMLVAQCPSQGIIDESSEEMNMPFSLTLDDSLRLF